MTDLAQQERSSDTAIGKSEQECRVNLAAMYRLIEMHFGYEDGIYTHIALRLPEEPDKFLIKRHELLYREVTASNLIKVDSTQELDERSNVNRPGFILHSAILRARPDINCSVHIHSRAGLALSAHANGLRMLTQNSLRFYNRVGYHAYEGLVTDPSERERIVEALGDSNIAVVLRNHGLVIAGASARDAFERTRDFLIAADTQLRLEAAGAPVVEIAPELCEHVVRQWEEHDRGRGTSDWPAWIRLLDSQDISYRL